MIGLFGLAGGAMGGGNLHSPRPSELRKAPVLPAAPSNWMLMVPENVELEGAAGNTGAFLNSLGLGECKLPPPMAPPANPNRPIIHTASFNVPTKINLLSPYGQSEEYRSIC